MNETELLRIIAEIGSALIEYGAEIYRAEESALRIAEAYGYAGDSGSAEIFVIPASFIITVYRGDNPPVTRVCRIFRRETNLDRVDRLNSLSRYIVSEKPDYQTVLSRIEEIKKRPVYGFYKQLMSYATVGAIFALFFGGGLSDALFAGMASIFIFLISTAASKIKPSIFFQNVLTSLMTASFAVILTDLGVINGFDYVIIGASMTCVPGVTLTNCMRDFIAGDFLAGLYTMTEALLTAVGMAVGAAAGIALFS